ncbi:hypothetical protein D3C71_1845620 [compost metagenome]
MGADGARGVVGDLQDDLAAQDAAGRVDLVGRQLGRLHHAGRHHAIGARQADRHADAQGLGGVRAGGDAGQQCDERQADAEAAE